MYLFISIFAVDIGKKIIFYIKNNYFYTNSLNHNQKIKYNKLKIKGILLIGLFTFTSGIASYQIIQYEIYQKNYFIGVLSYEYQSLRMASEYINQMDNISKIISPRINMVKVWTNLEIEVYPLPDISDLESLINETDSELIIISEWSPYHPFNEVNQNHIFLINFTDVLDYTTGIYIVNNSG